MSTPGATAVAQEQHATIRVLLISAAAALGGFLFGYDTAVINGAVDAIRGAFGLSAAATGFAVSCALLGSALGAWYAGPLADRYGRVQTMRHRIRSHTPNARPEPSALTASNAAATRIVCTRP